MSTPHYWLESQSWWIGPRAARRSKPAPSLGRKPVSERRASPKLLSFEIVAFTHGAVFHASQSSPPALDAEGPRCRIYFEMLITGRSDLDAETN